MSVSDPTTAISLARGAIGGEARWRSLLRGAKWLSGLVGIVVVLVLWWAVSAIFFSGANGAVPSPVAVAGSIVSDGWGFYGPNIAVTGMSALEGFVIGNLVAIAIAVLAALVPRAEGVVTQIGVISYCMPLLALGPLILVILGGRAPSVFLAAVSVFFTTMVGTLTGLKSADRASMDLVTAAGGSGWQRVFRVQAIACLPNLVGSLKIAAPAAILGAILGEYLGGVDSGVGVALTAAQANFDVPRTWGLALAAGAMAILAYGILSLVDYFISRVLFGGAERTNASVGFGETSVSSSGGIGAGIVRIVGPIIVAVAVVIALWVAVLALFPQIGPVVGRTPIDVWNYLFTGTAAAAARAKLWGDLLVTLSDTGIGFVFGMGVALVGASIMAASRSIRQTMMPLATMLRSVPLVAMTPVIVLIFGRGFATVAVMGCLVVVFPAIVMMMTGLQSAPRQARDVVSAYGGGVWAELRHVSIPSAIPSIFSAARISVPGALVAALITEWLGTGQGLGATIILAIPQFDYNLLWASIVVVTGASIVLYTIVSAIERMVFVAFGGSAHSA
ncbi:ABC transporter permease [Humibacter antri]